MLGDEGEVEVERIRGEREDEYQVEGGGQWMTVIE